MATPPLAPDPKGKRQARVDRLTTEALTTANEFRGSTVGYDLSHDIPLRAGSNELAMMRFSPGTMSESAYIATREWLKELSSVDEALGNKAMSFSSLNIDNTNNQTLFFTSRAEKGRDAPFATAPVQRAPRPRGKEETPEENKLYTQHLFNQLAAWLERGPTQNFCIRAWQTSDAMDYDGRHVFSITIPASERAALDAIEQELRTPQTGLLPQRTQLLEDKRFASHVERITQDAHQPKNRFGRDRILYDLAQITEIDGAERIYVQHIHASNRDDPGMRFIRNEWDGKKEFHAQAEHGDALSETPDRLTPSSPEADTLTIRLNPDSHTRNYTPRQMRRLRPEDNDLRRESIVNECVEPLKQWLKEQGISHFEIGLREIPSSHMDMPNSFLLRLSVSTHDAHAREQLGKIKDTIENFKLKTYPANSKGGLTL